jgi:cell division protease FtsH
MKKSIKNLIKNLGVAFLFLLIISSVFTLYSNPMEKPEKISLSQLVAEINQEKVELIEIEGDRLKIKLKDEDGKSQESLKEGGVSLGETLKNYGVEAEKLDKVNIEIKEMSGREILLGSILPIFLPFFLIIGFFWLMLSRAQKANTQAMGFGRSLARMIKPDEQKKEKKITFKDVAGLKEAKEELQEVVEFLRHPKKFTDLGAKIPKGVLLIGAPGTGKTLLARAVANEAKVPFFNISGSEFVEMFVGVGASRVRDTFRTAKKNAPAILFIDELDAIGRHRGTGLGGGHDEREQTLNQILVEMDGFEPDVGVIVISATNRPDVLDPALLRPGRFDRRIVLDIPDIKEREEILKIHSIGKPLAKGVNLKRVAERTPGFSGADLANLINEAAILAARYNKKIIGNKEIFEAVEKVLLGPERKSHILSKDEKKIAAYHEAGHALAAALLPHTDPVHKISIIARGRAAGYTLKLPIVEKRLRSRLEFLDELVVLMGGYAAEKLIFKDITTGASNDLKEASGLARKLVTEYGMSEEIGPVSYAEDFEMVFLGRDLIDRNQYSEDSAKKIDQEVSRLINNAYQKAEKILTEKKEKLTQIAEVLIKKETIEKDEFKELMKAENLSACG